MNCSRLLSATVLLVASVSATPRVTAQTAPVSPASSAAPVSYASVSAVNSVLAQLEQASQTLNTDLGRLRVERWKTDNDGKHQAQSNIDSLQRNLTAALPTLITQLRAAPDDLAVTFKLYRNLSAVYDVLSNVTELAGAFGSREEFQSIATDSTALDQARRVLADRMESLAQSKENEISGLRNQVKTLQAAVPPAPPKKIIVDDDVPKKPAARKKAVPKTATPAKPPVG